ncbi:MAG: guanosine-3',5'-bis(diphosphate) 3'-pyrophosphohydrolase [Acinetobacter sp.]|uniref:guanosine-3',5'-bis(diphosphate) 3'-pyrophosphohydrolase n=1 Tax=Acinetobacter sp. TaxID=472 RepID=UPI0026DFBED8|nr:guanosine-3',5'-bis(diphosphate) 3'-pyrophosphohydrolase [Acinetobacter sp.]MDO5541874.1 guanosine-3',5'-bis(diphosphate) 3'-pyrophosphohydrolase [Acinetobacter sp.]
MATLENAITLAVQQHAGQLDKGGQPYILHPLRVMLQLQQPDQQIVAVLHDILEDTHTTALDLQNLGFQAHIIQAIQALTKLPHETRVQTAKRTAQNSLACAVKIADVQDNMNLARIPNPTARDLARLEEYRQVLDILQKAQQ